MLNIAVLPGDGVGPEVTAAAVAVLQHAAALEGIELCCNEHPFGGKAIDEFGTAFPQQTADAVDEADAVLLGTVGGRKWEGTAAEARPESAVLELRRRLGAYANLRPARVLAGLEHHSCLRDDIARDADVLIVRELSGGIYHGLPRGRSADEGWNTMRYRRGQVQRVARVAFSSARARARRVTHVDKANALECSAFFRDVVTHTALEFPDVELDHAYVDAAALRLISDPRSFDVILTENLFGDILSDVAAALPGSLDVLPSVTLGTGAPLFEPVHGPAPDIAGMDIANPAGAILSAALLLEHAAKSARAAASVRRAVDGALRKNPTRDLGGDASTGSFAHSVIAQLEMALEPSDSRREPQRSASE